MNTKRKQKIRSLHVLFYVVIPFRVRNGPVRSAQWADTQYAMGGTQYVVRNGRYAVHSTQ